MPKISRRSFIVGGAAVGGGLALGLRLPFGPEVVRAADGSPEINAWVVIRPDDTVVIRVARSEMGQGTITGLAQLVAEELECNWAKVVTEYPTPGQNVARKRVWGDFSTGGSRGIRTSHDYVRMGGATAREMLVQAAANEWKVPAAECSALNSVITHKASGRTTSYGKVAEAAAKLEPPKDVKLKDPKNWKIAGRPVKRLDTVDRVTGKQVYGFDLKLPGMVNAAIMECPVFGGKVKSFDAAKVAKMNGVKKVVKVGDTAVAVVADTWWHAKVALDALPIAWDEGPNAKVSSASIADILKAGLDAEQAFVGNRDGDAKSAIAGAAKKIEAVYAYPYQNHVCMEPMNATARYTPDKCEVWVPTQDGEGSFAALLAASGLPADKCEVYKINLGGGFGRRGAFQDYVTQAVQIAKEMPGVPVKLLWSREEDMRQGRFHPVMQCKLTGAFDAQNNLTGLHMRLSGQSILASVRPAVVEKDNGRDALSFQGVFETGEHSFGYTIPNLLIDHAMRNPHVPPGFWRGVNINQNAVFIECFMDELAEAAGVDALEFRRQLMAKHPRNLGVLNAVAEKIGWGKPAKGRHLGLAHMKAFNSFVAAAAEVSVEGGNKVKIHRMVAATDCGYAVNPAQIERQIDGSFVYGLSALFMQECTVKGGRIEQENFNTYDSMRIAQMPKVESIIMPTGGTIWGGIGEPTICVAAPAVLNALYRATGKRIRSVPLKNHGFQLV
ncbi:MAG TPA: molybdopterin cofactor-binding domain-containing protein [Burkholderiales bacterium]|nr:molybdopterin cofactor-binding domain-containing protein [Burkholderiales bacterium]